LRGRRTTTRQPQQSGDGYVQSLGGNNRLNIELLYPRLPKAGNGVIQLRVQSVSDDYLTCKTWDGTSLGDESYKVAKPEELRKKPFSPTNTTGDDKTYTYSSSTARTVLYVGSNTTLENQIIDPPYRLPDGDYKGSLVFACYVEGGVSVTLNPGEEDEEQLEYIDLNVEGRTWVGQYKLYAKPTSGLAETQDNPSEDTGSKINIPR